MLCLPAGGRQVIWSQVFSIFLKSQAVIGLDYSTVTQYRECLRTNNDLEQIFGRVRHHQRRCTGRKVAPASLVLRGSVQARCEQSLLKLELSSLSS